MFIVVPGHKYILSNLENPQDGQVLQFIHKEKLNPTDEKLTTIVDGTTNEEVLKAMIDRLQTQNAKLPNRDTSIAITHLEDALMRLERRIKDRTDRGVYGTMKQ